MTIQKVHHLEKRTPMNPGQSRTLLPVWVAVFVVFAALFGMTASRGIQWQDAGEHIVRMMQGVLINPRGLALSHPLHFWFGRVALQIPWLEPSYAVTLISALAGAVTVANVCGCAMTLTGRVRAGIVTALSLGVAHTFWQMSTIAECNTVTTALLSAEVWAMLAFLLGGSRRFLLLAILVNGVGIANHMQASLTTPILAFVLILAIRRHRAPGRYLWIAAALWLVGSLPYTGLILLTAIRSGAWLETMRSALFGHTYTEEVLNLVPSWRQLGVVTGFVLLSFPNLTLPLFGVGILRRPGGDRLASYRFLLAALAMHALFAGRYNVVDQHTFFLPTYLILSIFAGVGYAHLTAKSRERGRHGSTRTPAISARLVGAATWALLATTPVIYAFVPGIARQWNVLRDVARDKPYRDDYDYLFVPWTVTERSAERVGRQAVALSGANGLVIVEDRMAAPAVEYERIMTHQPNIDLVSVSLDGSYDEARVEQAAVQGRHLVLVPRNRDHPAFAPPFGTWRRDGDLYFLDRDAADSE